MSNPIDNLFGMHTQALALWQRRSEVLASNLANADTPDYQARDIDFRQALGAAQAAGADAAQPSLPLATSSNGQIGTSSQNEIGSQTAAPLAYRVPLQPSMDGNTVDTQLEQAEYAGNTVHYQASLSFITSQIHMLRTAITGGQS